MNKLWGTLLAGLVLIASFGNAQTTKEYVGDWVVERTRDLFTDEQSAGAYVFPTQYPRLGQNDVLVVLCSDPGSTSFDGVAVMIAGSTYIADSTVSVERRAGSRPASTESWFANGTTVVVHRGEVSRAFVVDLLDVETLAVRYRGYSETVTYVFPVAGFREVLASLGCYSGSAL